MKILNLKIIPQAPTRFTINAVCEGEIDYNLPSAIIGKDYELIIQEKKHKRTLTANAYYQVLLDKLCRAVGTSREEMHEQLLIRYGTTAMINGSPVLFTLRADINPHLVSKYVEIMKMKEVKGKMFAVYRVLKGSSEMDSKEFAHLLEGLISECQEVGIETMTPEEIARLKYD